MAPDGTHYFKKMFEGEKEKTPADTEKKMTIVLEAKHKLC